MHLHHLTFLPFLLIFFSGEPTPENSRVTPAKDVKSSTASHSDKPNATPAATNLMYQSMDGGKTWQDISYTLPENEEPALFAGESGLYLRYNDKLYYSKSNLKTPVWEKENDVDPQYTGDHPFDGSVAFNPSGVTAFGWNVQVYQKMNPAEGEVWSPVYPGFREVMSESRRNWIGTVFETSDGTILVGGGGGLYKSADKGKGWKHVMEHGWVSNLVESEGVLIATSSGGIIRSTDNGEHWYWAIREGGVGIAVERIDGGFATISYNTKTKSRSIHVSFDTGKTWNRIDAGLLPSPNISSIKQIGNYLIVGHPDGIFRSSDMGRTWVKVHGSVDNSMTASIMPLTIGSSNQNPRVFAIYVSGNVVYAVARRAGC
ncbi:exo-alpha-sialidase [Chryseolinea sp. T2]|uniref:WD40/YVTN/BNR-like repeat-containing protein n=1 Tax=Chryseolinea sp. T2 TaxID=3129255 RepID=UPI0030775A65